MWWVVITFIATLVGLPFCAQAERYQKLNQNGIPTGDVVCQGNKCVEHNANGIPTGSYKDEGKTRTYYNANGIPTGYSKRQ